MTEPITPRDQFHCRKCFKHWPMNMLDHRERGQGVCTNCAARIRRRREQR